MLIMTSKQKSLQSAYAFLSNTALWTTVCVSCIWPGPLAAQSPPKGPDETASTMRLLSAAGLDHGHYEAGVAITMAPGAHTYWKMPGEAGVPPVFAFNGSQNASAATIAFPAPTRITEEGLDAFGYTGEVVFPVMVEPLDPSKPVILHADVTYAVCGKICVPAHGEATLTLTPKGAGESPALVTAALAAVPARAGAEGKALTLTPTKPTAADLIDKPKPSWLLTWTGDGIVEDIFADAPDGFFFTTKKTGPSTWLLVADQGVGLVGADAVPVSLTLKRAGRGLVVTEKLDVTKPIQ